MTLEQLRQPVKDEYDSFLQEYRLHASVLADACGGLPPVGTGKQLRPLLLLLSAKTCGTGSDKHILLAVAVEMLHNATLMHDDVVDESDTRRGQPSLRKTLGNQTAVLCGDHLLAQTMLLLQEIGSPEASSLFAKTVADMTRGELLQLDITRSRQATLDEYLEIISLKTASLMAACCQLGASNLVDTSSPASQSLRAFGLHYGMAFQIHDDLGSLDPRHDASYPQGINPEQLIAEHTEKAREALAPLPTSPARDALLSLLSPSAPMPS